MRAMAELGPEPQQSKEVAALLDRTSEQMGPTRSRLIDKGLLYTPGHGLAAFTVPQFDRFMRRTYQLMNDACADRVASARASSSSAPSAGCWAPASSPAGSSIAPATASRPRICADSRASDGSNSLDPQPRPGDPGRYADGRPLGSLALEARYTDRGLRREAQTLRAMFGGHPRLPCSGRPHRRRPSPPGRNRGVAAQPDRAD